jgi:NADH:ubiquinone oxidoreductase subunit 6 (subunit J)
MLFAAGSLPELWPLLVPLVVGAAAVYLLLPRPQPFPTLWGALLGIVALVLAGFLLVRPAALAAETFLFYAFSAIAIVAGTLLVTQHNPGRAALSFALVVLSTCGLFLLLAAPFLMAATIIIYAGAIIVTFLFVLMLAQQSGLDDADLRSREPLLAAVTGFVLLAAVLYVLRLDFGTRDLDAALEAIDAADRREDGKALLREAANARDLLTKALTAANFKDLTDQIENEVQLPASPDKPEAVEAAVREARRGLDQLRKLALAARNRIGFVQLRDRPGDTQLSPLSGPPLALQYQVSGDAAGREVRRDDTGRPAVPADNATYLGRSLFTDYLLPVELGGLLLLVAVVGAVVITHRRPEKERPA